MTVINLENVTHRYGEQPALDTLSLSISSGELFGFLGPNGAGKTTVINIITGQLVPDSGSVEVLGHDPTENPVAVREQIGVVPERESPPSYLTPQIYFEFVGKSRGIPADTLSTRIEEWASRLDLTDHLNTLNKDLSRGQQQKVMIAQAFLHNPDLVIIDEPLANLDPISQETVKQHFEDYRKDGNTLLISTHHIEVATEICTTIGVLTDGAPELKDPAHDEVTQESLLNSFTELDGDTNE